jgi:hypothetical protein
MYNQGMWGPHGTSPAAKTAAHEALVAATVPFFFAQSGGDEKSLSLAPMHEPFMYSRVMLHNH